MNVEKILYTATIIILFVVSFFFGREILHLRKSVKSIRSDVVQQLYRNNQLESDITRLREVIRRGSERAEQQLSDNESVRGVIREIQKSQQLLENDDVYHDWNYSDFISDNSSKE